jgi:hypothetical protein
MKTFGIYSPQFFEKEKKRPSEPLQTASAIHLTAKNYLLYEWKKRIWGRMGQNEPLVP